MKEVYERLKGKKVLVTGATGFIGGRLVEKLALEYDVHIKVLVRDLTRLPRIARFPVEIVKGDITCRDDVDRAVSGCDFIFHCVAGKSSNKRARRKVFVEGTRNLLESARRRPLQRIVHLSSLTVYGYTPDGAMDESAPKSRLDDVYAKAKLEEEMLVREYGKRHGLPVTILQPTGVYGPYADVYGAGIIQQLNKRKTILVNGGSGLFNSVYIDDLIQAMLLAAVKKEAIGEQLLVSGEAVTWKEFYSRFESILGEPATVEMSLREARDYSLRLQRQRRVNEWSTRVRRSIGALLPGVLKAPLLRMKNRRTASKNIVENGIAKKQTAKPVAPHGIWALRFYESKTLVRIDKARRILGYEPKYSFEQGMHLTEQWIRWANLAP